MWKNGLVALRRQPSGTSFASGTHLFMYAVRLWNKAHACYTFKAERCVQIDIFLRFGLDLLVSGLLKLLHLLLHWISYQRAHFLHTQTHASLHTHICTQKNKDNPLKHCSVIKHDIDSKPFLQRSNLNWNVACGPRGKTPFIASLTF